MRIQDTRHTLPLGCRAWRKKTLFFQTLLWAIALCVALLPAPGLTDTISDLSLQAESGSVGAMRKLAQIYNDSTSEHFSPEQAFTWFLSAAKKGSVRAQRAVGAMYELGRGTAQNYGEAAYWYEKAADQGLARAQTNLGYLYENGLGVEKNESTAFALYQKAAKQGYARGQVFLGKAYEQAKGTTSDFSAANHWYSQAALQGYSRGQFNLGRLYEKGFGVEKNLNTAMHWYEKAAAQNFYPAKQQLALMKKQFFSLQKKPKELTHEDERILVPVEYVATIKELSNYELRHSTKNAKNSATFSAAPFSALMSMECSDFNLQYLEREILSVEAEIAGSDPGLKSETSYRFKDGDTDDDRNEFSTGLSWDLLNDGLFENQSQSRRLTYQRQIEEIQAEQIRHKELFKCRDTFLFTAFNNLKQTIQERKQKVLSQLLELSRKAYFLGDILADDLLKIEFEVKKTEAILGNYALQSKQAFTDQQELFPELPDVIVPNLPAIVSAIETDSAYPKIARLNEAILEEQYDPLYKNRLRFYVKGGLSEDRGDFSSGDVSAGMSLSIPLFQKTEEVLPYKVNRSNSLIKKRQEDLLAETARLHNAYSEKYSDAIQLFYRMQTVAERLRRSLLISENRKNSTGTYGFDEHILVLRHLDELLDTRFEYIAVQESLYRQLLHLFTLTQTNWDQKFVEPATLDSELNRGRIGNRAIYIWADEFQKYDNRLLEQLFLAKGISKAVVSASKAVNRQKLGHFIELAKLNGIGVELMLSENSWVLPEKWPVVEKTLTELCEFKQTIHLDIEPHTLADYHQRKQEYDTYFFDLIRKIRQITTEHNLQLSIALPVLYDSQYTEAIAELADHLYIMAYGKLNQEKLTKKIAPFSNIDKNKLVLALRPSDYGSELKQEEFIDLASEKAKLNSFALHDLSQFLKIAGQ